MFFTKDIVSRIDVVVDEITRGAGVQLGVLREDEIHPHVSGNKFRKLKYNVMFALENRAKGIITYGGQHSNHIAATAYACQLAQLPCMGYIRQGYFNDTSPTLEFAKEQGMEIIMIPNDEFTVTKISDGIDINHWFHVPEGGANQFGVEGCKEIMHGEASTYANVATACGTGSTLAGMLIASTKEQQLIGVNALKAPGMIQNQVLGWTDKSNFMVLDNYHFGGYAKASPELFKFINWFYKVHGIKLDAVYTGKLMFAMYQEMEKGNLVNTSLLAVHTGGLQGNKGIEKRYDITLFEE